MSEASLIYSDSLCSASSRDLSLGALNPASHCGRLYQFMGETSAG